MPSSIPSLLWFLSRFRPDEIMPRARVTVGYVETQEKAPGAFVEVATEHNYYADIIRNARRLQSTETLNDNVLVNNSIEIVAADDYAMQNFFDIRYVKWNGANWKVSNVEVRRPRLVLTLGGVYNGTKV